MQSIPTGARWRGWLQWGGILVLGIALGLLQFLLIEQANLLQRPLSSQPTTLGVGTLLYLFIAALAGFLAARRSAKVASGTRAGCLVGGLGFLTITLTLYLLVILAPASPPCPNCVSQLSPAAAANLGWAVIIGILYMEAFAGVVGGLVGGLMGGLMGRGWAVASNQGSATTADDRP